MRGIDGIGNWVLVVMAVASLVSMIAAFGAYMIVDHDLYSYGLRFSYGWAIPYWNAIGTVFAMAWLSIIAAIAFQIYRIRTIRKEETQTADEQFENMLKLKGEHENAGYDDWDEKTDTENIVIGQAAMQEAEEQAQIIPYEPVTCEQIESIDSEQTEE
jgi:hypothetical protein